MQNQQDCGNSLETEQDGVIVSFSTGNAPRPPPF